MAFRCPQCLTRDSLEIAWALELPPDSLSEEISLQVVTCGVCKFRGLAVYEESRRGDPEVDTWQHIGYWVSPDSVDSIIDAIHACPDPHNPHCRCEAHLSLARKDVRGVWHGLVEMERGHTFLMRLAV